MRVTATLAEGTLGTVGPLAAGFEADGYDGLKSRPRS